VLGAHILTIRLLDYINEVAEAAESAGVPVEGLPGGAPADSMLQE
jgi:hypothetical protein